jgi:hypothetical protein
MESSTLCADEVIEERRNLGTWQFAAGDWIQTRLAPLHIR